MKRVALHMLSRSVHSCQQYTSPSRSSSARCSHTCHCTPWRSQHTIHFAGFGISHLQQHESVKRVAKFVNFCQGSVALKHLGRALRAAGGSDSDLHRSALLVASWQTQTVSAGGQCLQMLGGSADHRVCLQHMSGCGFMVNADKHVMIRCLQRQGVWHTRSGALSSGT
jgi:hypothetical protein